VESDYTEQYMIVERLLLEARLFSWGLRRFCKSSEGHSATWRNNAQAEVVAQAE